MSDFGIPPTDAGSCNICCKEVGRSRICSAGNEGDQQNSMHRESDFRSAKKLVDSAVGMCFTVTVQPRCQRAYTEKANEGSKDCESD